MAASIRRHRTIRGPWAAAEARREMHGLVADALLAGKAVGEVTEADAMLVVSELVTNAVRHAGGGCSVDLTLRPDAMDIDVSDQSREPPHPRSPSSDGDGGYGWGIIARLTSELTVMCHGSGKTVHARIDLPR
ncbi:MULTISPECIES: ATP-binding protein [Streptomyces]|uniref:ATP-binding protein n=1 Tax=Streptomyces TaxID=1883 RepID=UPI001009C37F|nr:ATP-binding protein [Streptomyces roseicoloratus]